VLVSLETGMLDFFYGKKYWKKKHEFRAVFGKKRLNEKAIFIFLRLHQGLGVIFSLSK
jgi:hypothetical protein